MSTQLQIEANRLNAQKSTGPRTAEGKAISSMNALKSGLDSDAQSVYGEDRADFCVLRTEYFGRFAPLYPEERFQVDTLIRCEWMLRRFFRAEAHLWEYQAMRANRHEGTPLGEALAKGSDVFMRLQRRITRTEQSYKEAMSELKRLQSARQPAVPIPPEPEPVPEPQPEAAEAANAAPAVPQPQETTSETPKLGSFLTFPFNGSRIEDPRTQPDPASPGLDLESSPQGHSS